MSLHYFVNLIVTLDFKNVFIAKVREKEGKKIKVSLYISMSIKLSCSSYFSGGPLDLLSRRVLCASTVELADEISKSLVQFYPERD